MGFFKSRSERSLARQKELYQQNDRLEREAQVARQNLTLKAKIAKNQRLVDKDRASNHSTGFLGKLASGAQTALKYAAKADKKGRPIAQRMNRNLNSRGFTGMESPFGNMGMGGMVSGKNKKKNRTPPGMDWGWQ